MKNYVNLILLIAIAMNLSLSCKQSAGSEPTSSTQAMVEEEAKDPLPSWNEGATKRAIISYVESISDPGTPDFIPEADRIATFDNDGTLWSEQPVYFQLFFALDRISEMAPDHPEWKTVEPFRSALAGDMKALEEQGLGGLLKIVMVTHAGMESEEFNAVVKKWVASALHPTKKVSYTQLVYQPMLELLEYLRKSKFKVYIVSGGGLDFMRAFATEVYGVPAEQIIGSRIATSFEIRDGEPGIYRQPELDFIDDKEGKPINIQRIIGKKPVLAGGNSDGDLAMLQWTSSSEYRSFPLYLHHTDSIREWAYDRDSHIGQFDKGLDEAAEKGWTVIDMAKDWKVIYPFELSQN
jgi:phosphoserine phosphatase